MAKVGAKVTITEKSKPEFAGPGVEGKKLDHFIITIRDGVPKKVLFDESGKEIGIEDLVNGTLMKIRPSSSRPSTASHPRM